MLFSSSSISLSFWFNSSVYCLYPFLCGYNSMTYLHLCILFSTFSGASSPHSHWSRNWRICPEERRTFLLAIWEEARSLFADACQTINIYLYYSIIRIKESKQLTTSLNPWKFFIKMMLYSDFFQSNINLFDIKTTEMSTSA